MAARKKTSRSRTTKKATKRAKESPRARKQRLQAGSDRRLFMSESARAYGDMAKRGSPKRRKEFAQVAGKLKASSRNR